MVVRLTKWVCLFHALSFVEQAKFLICFNPFFVGLILTARHHVLRNSLKMLDNVAKIKARNYLFIIGKASY